MIENTIDHEKATCSSSTSMQSSADGSILSLPADVLMRCIIPYLRKDDQYELLSSCKGCKPLLLDVRTNFLVEVTAGKQTNIYLWNRFLENDRLDFLHALCYSIPSAQQAQRIGGNNIRKIRLEISMRELYNNQKIVFDIAEYLHQLHIVEKTANDTLIELDAYGNSTFRSKYELPKIIDNPTSYKIQRWLKSSRLEIAERSESIFQITTEYLAQVQSELGEHEVVPAGDWSELRGVSKVISHSCDTTGRLLYVEIASDANDCLQSVSFDHCGDVVEDPSPYIVTLRNCPHYNHIESLKNVAHVYLNRISIPDLRMLGGVKKLELGECKVTHYPIPTIGKEQAWEFSLVDIVDLSGLQSLEKLTLSNCNNVKDGSMLGGVQTLTICGGCMEHFPVPTTGKGQHWTFKYVHITHVSGLASLESLTLIGCKYVTDLSMLGAVRHLTIEGCMQIRSNGQYIPWVNEDEEETLLSPEQYPKPVGRFQEWTFRQIDMSKVPIEIFAGIHQVSFNHCKISLTKDQLLDLHTCEISYLFITGDFNLRVVDRKIVIVDKATLKSAVELWCKDEATAKHVYGDIEKWDVSKVKDMSYLFTDLSTFNNNINNWDVSNVTNMCSMFKGASSFNQPLATWDVSNVTDMSFMFFQATSFNQPLNSWVVSNVTTMGQIFECARSFNQPLDTWDMSKVTYMRGMFHKAASFNQPLNSWDVSNAIDIAFIFREAISFNQPLDSWDVSKCANMKKITYQDRVESMFFGATSFNQSLDSWNISSELKQSMFTK